MSFMEANGYRLYYETHGDGDPLLLLHHGFGCTKIWKGVYPLFQRAGYRTLMYDRRGYGRTEGGDAFWEFYRSERFRSEGVKELNAFVNALDLETFHLVGQCEGGVLAVDYALAHPGRVKTITISSTQCFSHGEMIRINREKFPVPFQDLDPAFIAKLRDWHGDERAQAFYDGVRRGGGAYGTKRFDLRPLLPGLTCPFLVLYPDRSALFEVEQGLAFYRHLVNGDLAVLPHCGHNTYESQPEEYARHIVQFLHRKGF